MVFGSAFVGFFLLGAAINGTPVALSKLPSPSRRTPTGVSGSMETFNWIALWPKNVKPLPGNSKPLNPGLSVAICCHSTAAEGLARVPSADASMAVLASGGYNR